MNEDFDAENKTPATEQEWQLLYYNWTKSYDAWLKQDDIDKVQTAACRSVVTAAARSTLECCKTNPEPAHQINGRLWNLARLIHELYEAATPNLTKEPKLKRTNTLWRHIDLGQFLRLTDQEEREFPFDARATKDISNTYIANQWMENPYLDWVFVDALMVAETVAYARAVMLSKYGMGYALFGVSWKAIVFRLFSVPISFALGWIAPGVFFFWLYGYYPTASLIVGAIYYGLSIFMLVRALIGSVLYRVRVGKSPRREQFDRLTAMEAAYAELRESVACQAHAEGAGGGPRDGLTSVISSVF